MLPTNDFADFLLEEGVFQQGDFTLKSGQKSSFFLNFGNLCQGRQLQRLGSYLAQALQRFDPTPTLLFGPAYKGIPLAVATVSAQADSLAYFSFRKESKEHGEVSALLGQPPRSGDRIVLIDDVLTTSQTKIEALQQLRAYAQAHQLDLKVLGVLVGVDRQGQTETGQLWSDYFTQETGLPVHSLLKLEQLLQRAQERTA